MVKQLDFGLPPNLTECFNLKFENNRGFIHTKVRKNDRGTSAKKNNVCLLPPFGSRHSLSSCNLCLKDRQKRPQFFCRCFQVLSGDLPKKHTCRHGLMGKFLTSLPGADGASRSMILFNKKPSGQRKTKGGEYPFAIWSAWSTYL